MDSSKVFLSIFILFGIIYKCKAKCGMTVRTENYKTCGSLKKSVLRFTDDFNIKLDNQCKVILEGCIKVLEDISHLVLYYEILRIPSKTVELAGEVQICKRKRCFPKMDECYKDTLKFGSFKKLFGLVGRHKFTLELRHNHGTDCIEFDLLINI